MKLISWNVNGLRACINKGFAEFVNAEKPDILCLQETKMQPEQLDFHLEGYYDFWNSAVKKGYSGTVTFTKQQPKSVRFDMTDQTHTGEGRIITCEYDNFFLVNVYTPNSQRELARLGYRMEWEDAFRGYLGELKQEKDVIVCGDLNVAHKEIDLKNPKTNQNNAGFTPQEREKFTNLLDSGFIDSFRYLYPDKTEAYTWWSYMFRAREKNAGWRIDYFLLTPNLLSKLQDSIIYSEIFGSDHCPVGLLLAD